MEKMNRTATKCGYADSAVSEILGAILLIAIVVTSLSIVGVVLWSQPPPQKLPALEAVISEDTGNQVIHIYHDGGDLLTTNDFQILLDGNDYTTGFTKGGASGWTTWATGESLDYTYAGTIAPATVQIMYTQAGPTGRLAAADFTRPGQTAVGSWTTGLRITATPGTGGSITPSGQVIVPTGGSQAFTVAPNTGYHLLDVTADGASQGAITAYTFTNVVANHAIAASFAINTYTITASAGSNGAISPSGAATVDYGAAPTYTITPNTGYRVADVLVDGVSVGAVTSYTFPSVSAAHTIAATFAVGTFTITSSAGSNGAISPAGATAVSSGGSQAYTITPSAGYSVAGVLVDGVSVGAVTSYTFTNVSAVHTIAATFGINTYTITASAGSNGAISPNGATAVSSGGSQAYTITPAHKYAVADVLVDGVSVGAVTSYTFTNVSASHTIAATFAINAYTITASAGSNGAISPNGKTTVEYGATQAYTITPNTGYHIASVLVDGASAGAVTSYTFTNVSADHTIAATFGINTYTITASAGANGAISPNGAATVNYGATPTYTITPSTGYHVASVLVDGVSVGAVTSYTFASISTGHTIAATFAINTYTITASAGSNGAISPSGAATVNYGATPTYTITPNAGCTVADVKVDGVSVGAVTSYTFASISAGHTIAATFYPRLVANFAWSSTKPSKGKYTVTFTDTSTGGPTSWYWTFSDGTYSTAQNPTHKYSTGTYWVNLRVTRSTDGSTDSIWIPVTYAT